MKEQERRWIEQLNRQAKLYRDAGMDTYEAIAQAAADFKLPVFVEGDDCRVYEAPDGIFVNCWVHDNDATQGKDGSNDDHSIQWYASKEETQGKEKL